MTERAGRSAPNRPNILLIMTDQQRWDALGCVTPWLETPNFDRLAAGGTRFANAYTGSPVCIPARVGMALGNYSHNHGVWGNVQYTLPPESATWMRALRSAGYHTSLFGKTHFYPHKGDLRDQQDLLMSYGFDVAEEVAGPRASTASQSNLTDLWKKNGVLKAYREDMRERYHNKPWVVRPTPLPFDLYADVYIARRAKEHLRDYNGEAPWMCWVSFTGPHEPWDTPEPYASKYRPQAMPPPLEFASAPLSRLPRRPTGALAKKLKNRKDISPDEIARLRADYAGHVSLIDDQVGEILHVVEERGELDNTAVVVVSDHGEMNGDFGLIYKDVFLGPAVRVPIIVRPPSRGQRADVASVTDAPVELTDVGATVLDLAGVTADGFGYGKSVLPLLSDPRAGHRPLALSELWGEIMMATQSWKMVLNVRGVPYLLFDLEADPSERHNLLGPNLIKRGRNKDVVRALHDQLLQRLAETGR